MYTELFMNLKVTPSQKETIDLRAKENGFDDTIAYVKVVALKAQAFNLTSAGSSMEEASVELSFKVTAAQQASIEEKMKECKCEDLNTYLLYISLHGVVTAVAEVRSTGALDSMLARIAASRKL